MAGYPRNSRSSDPRWELLATRDRLGRICYTRSPVVGARFGAITILVPGGVASKYTHFRCDCGNEHQALTRSIYRGRVVSCPTCGLERAAKARVRIHQFPTTELRSLWAHRYRSMLERCLRPEHPAFHNYGGRGITTHPQWVRDRAAFFDYVVRLPGAFDTALELDRLDNGRGYVPGNLRLVGRKQNARNRRTNRYVVWEGRRYTLAEFHERFLPEWRSPNTLPYHLAKGRSPEEIVARYRRTHTGL